MPYKEKMEIEEAIAKFLEIEKKYGKSKPDKYVKFIYNTLPECRIVARGHNKDILLAKREWEWKEIKKLVKNGFTLSLDKYGTARVGVKNAL